MKPLRVLAAIGCATCCLAAVGMDEGAAGLSERAVTVGGQTRHFLLYAPPGVDAMSPLLIAFHPSHSTGAKMRRMTGAALERLARASHALVAYPDGYEGHFDDCRKTASYSARTHHIDDVAFARALVDRVAKEQRFDRGRVYALGYSNGAQMALRLALEAPDLVAGVVAVAANLPTSDNNVCTTIEGPHPAVVLIEGTKDPINPYDGGEVTIMGLGDRGRVLSALDSARWFARRYGLDVSKQAPLPLSQGTLTARWQDWGAPMPRVRLITIDGGGHTVPQPDTVLPRFLLGATFMSDVPLQSAWEVLLGEGAASQASSATPNGHDAVSEHPER